MSNYTIEVHEHGVLIKGSLPMGQLEAAFGTPKALGFDRIDPGIASALGATFAFVSEESGSAWRAEIDSSAKHRHPSKIEAWRHGTDTGVSACTIAHVLCGTPLSSFGGNVPIDSSDFGRCRRLCALMGWPQEDLGPVAERFPPWKPLVERWGEMTDLYDAGDYEAVYGILRERERQV